MSLPAIDFIAFPTDDKRKIVEKIVIEFVFLGVHPWIKYFPVRLALEDLNAIGESLVGCA